MNSKTAIFPFIPKKTTWIPLVWSKIRAGFPSPAEDYIESGLDLNEFLIQRPSSTFIVRVEGHSMREAGIFHGNYLIVDRSIEASHGQIVLAVVNGEFTVKRFLKTPKGICLMPENSEYAPVNICDGMDFCVWGVVTSIIQKI